MAALPKEQVIFETKLTYLDSGSTKNEKNGTKLHRLALISPHVSSKRLLLSQFFSLVCFENLFPQFVHSQLQSTDKEGNQQSCKCLSCQGANPAIIHGRQTGHKHQQLLYMPPHLKEKGKSVPKGNIHVAAIGEICYFTLANLSKARKLIESWHPAGGILPELQILNVQGTASRLQLLYFISESSCRTVSGLWPWQACGTWEIILGLLQIQPSTCLHDPPDLAFLVNR